MGSILPAALALVGCSLGASAFGLPFHKGPAPAAEVLGEGGRHDARSRVFVAGEQVVATRIVVGTREDGYHLGG